MGKVGARCLTVDTARFRIDSGLESMIVIVTEGFLVSANVNVLCTEANDSSR